LVPGAGEATATTAVLETSPTPSLLPSPTQLSVQGAVFLRPSRFSATLTGLQEPGEGFAYHGWLVSMAGDLLPLGIAAWSDGQVRLTFDAPEEELTRYDTFLLNYSLVGDVEPPAVESIIMHGRLGNETLAQLQLLDEVSGGGNPIDSLLSGVVDQVGHYDSHRNFAINSAGEGDLAGAKSHSEHVLNIIEGRTGELYGDWNGNELVENPGDDVGLMIYLQLLGSYLEGAERLAMDETSRTTAVDARSELVRILERISQARTTARQIALADTIDIVEEVGLAAELAELGATTEVEALVAAVGDLDLALDLELSPGTP
jgi:hypothetical protein